MRGIICYESHEIARNQGFIDLWLRESARRGIALTLARLEETSFGLRDNAPYLRIGGQDAHPDFAVMRMKQPLLSRHLERMGVRVFNNAYTSEILNDKRRTHALFSHLSPMMDTAYITGGTYADLENTDTLRDILSQCLEQEAAEGTVNEYHLRYLSMDNGLYRKLAFVDMSMEQAVLRRLVRSYLLIALGAMLVLLGIAAAASRWVTRPVEKAWK